MSSRAPGSIALATMMVLAACGRGSEGPAAPNSAEAVQRAGAEAARAVAASARPTQMPALGSAVLTELAGESKDLLALLPALEARERAAIQHVMDDALAKRAPAAMARRPPPPDHFHLSSPRLTSAQGTGATHSVFDWFIAPAGAAEGGLAWGTLQAAALGYMFTGFFGTAANGGHGEAGQEQMRSEYSEKTGEKASIVVRTEADNQVTSELSTEIAVPLFLIEANSKVSITSRGLCPDENGSVEFTVRFNSGGHRGAGQQIAFDRSREAHVKVTVNDDAEIASADIDTKYADHFMSGNRPATVEGATSWNTTSAIADNITATGHDVVHAPSGSAEEQRFTEALIQAMVLGQSALIGAKSRWQDGTCIRINANSPGTVKRKTISEIPVNVTHRPDGGDIAAKVTVELTGGESVTPLRIPRTPGTLAHTAPDARSAQISIKLTARSRRGMAEETLKLQVVDASFSADGGAGEFHGTGLICSLAAPFEISGNGITAKFMPTSEQGGTYSYDGSVAGFHLYGKGTYKVIVKDDTPVEIFATGPGYAGTARGEGDEHYTLTPVQDSRCNNASVK